MEREGTSLLIGDSFLDKDLYYLCRSLVHGRIALITSRRGQTLLLPLMEVERVRAESPITDIRSLEELGYVDAVRAGRQPREALADCLAGLLGQPDGPITVSSELAVSLADTLRARGYELDPVADTLAGRRRRKSPQEVAGIEDSLRATAEAIDGVRQVLAGSSAVDGALVGEEGPLTAEDLKQGALSRLLAAGYWCEGLIIAGGTEAAQPHNEGSGPLRAGETIVVDIFPYSMSHRYHGDMTRTYSVGRPAPVMEEVYEAVLAAQELGISMLEPGRPCREVHDAICEAFLAGGYLVGEEDGRRPAYLHSTGHGLGLDVHEDPALGATAEVLEPGDVVTVEPGLYLKGVGGVRIEDVFLVTEEGSRVLSHLDKGMLIS